MAQALVPHRDSGNGGAGGMVIRPIQPLSSSGSDGSSSRYQRMTAAVSAKSYRTGPPTTDPCSPMSWQRKVNDVTTPKLPPPPRSAQNRSLCSLSALAVTNDPSASTTSADSRLSTVRPKRRDRYPMPPPSVRPATPVEAMNPDGVAMPNATVAWSTSPQVQPGSTRTVWSSGLTVVLRSSDRSMTRASSATASPAALCPPPRMAM